MARIIPAPALVAVLATVAVLGFAFVRAMAARRLRAQLSDALARRRSEERLRGAYDALGFGVVAQNAAGEVTHVNEAARELLGLTLDQLQGRAPLTTNWRLVNEDGTVADPAAHPLAVARRTGEPVRNVVLGVVNGAGDVRWILVNAFPVIDPETGRLGEAIASFVDITERRKAQAERQAQADELARTNDELRRANEQLLATAEEAETARITAEAANRAKSDFLAVMSHELRTPLNAILGYTELMELNLAGPLSEQQRAYLERVRASGKHLLGLIDEVLDIAKVESGRLTLEHEQARIERVVDAAAALIRPQAAARRIRLTALCDAAADAAYVGDEVRVRQILVNLLSNAVKFTPPGGAVTLRCAAEPASTSPRLTSGGPWLAVRVEDSGIGIPPDKLEQIFEPFVQIDAGPTRAHGGTGLGLAISRRLARLMGGDITAESVLGRGSTFTLWLPAPVIAGGPAAVATPPARARSSSADTPVTDVAAIGDILSAGTVDDIVATMVDRLRADPATPEARELSDEVLRDHFPSLISDLAQALTAARDPGDSTDLLRDGTEIQRVLSDRHGAQRYRYGWTEAALRRELEILRQEIETVVRRNAPAGADAAVGTALRTLRRLLDRAEELSFQGFRRASADAGRPDGGRPADGETQVGADSNR